jgi:glutamate N-acetyltransferase / amino-acid N-acetyltransferase
MTFSTQTAEFLTTLTDVAGGVVAPQGYACHAVMAGIKDPTKLRLDLTLLVSKTPAYGAATFTSNKVKAAPVLVSMGHLKNGRGKMRAIIANSGNANACTGPRGLQDAKEMCMETAKALGIKPAETMVCSTGIIGLPLPMERITPKIPALAKGLQSQDGHPMAQAIMTSDTHKKSVAVEFILGGKTIRIGACAKGAGMICPSMGTMFCFVTTDAALAPDELYKATLDAVEHSFNRISVDGDTSTNDTVIVMANGAAGNKKIESGTRESRFFRAALFTVMLRLAKMLVNDGERGDEDGRDRCQRSRHSSGCEEGRRGSGQLHAGEVLLEWIRPELGASAPCSRLQRGAPL